MTENYLSHHPIYDAVMAQDRAEAMEYLRKERNKPVAELNDLRIRLAWYAQFDAQLNPPWASEGE